jgi:hypothetical protein
MAGVVIVSRDTDEDQAFADTIHAELSERGAARNLLLG